MKNCTKYCTEAPILKPLKTKMVGCSHIKFSQVTNKTDTGFPQNPEASETFNFQNYIEVIYTDLHK